MTQSEHNTNLGLLLGDRANARDTAVIAIDIEGNASEHTCTDLDSASRAVANFVMSQGFPQGSSIAIMAANSIEYLFAYLGIIRAGFVCVPINIKQPRETIAFIVQDSEVLLTFVDDQGLEQLNDLTRSAHLDQLPTDSGDYIDAPTNPKATAEILYTSGSTGRPKGVVLSHASQLSMINSVNDSTLAALFRNQRGIVVAPMFHMNALLFIGFYMAGGGSIVLMSKFDADLFARAIEQHDVNVITGVPTMIALLFNAWQSMEQPNLSSVHTVYIGSAPVTEAIVDQALEMMPDARVINSYGTTETGGGLFGPHPDGIPQPPTAVGYPNPGIGVRLEGPDENEGVLVVNAPSAMTKYLNLPELTAAKIKDGWINTGDIFYRDGDGYYYFIGRNDDMFVCSGENIFPGEVERVLESHPDVDQASVVPVPDVIRGQMPVAWVVSRSGETSEQALQKFVRAHAAPYMYPRKIWFIDELPLAGTSKIDRNQLRTDACDILGIRE